MGDSSEVNTLMDKIASNYPSLSVSYVISSSSNIPQQGTSSPTSTSAQSIPQTQEQDVTSLSEMFPLLSETTIRSALYQCQGNPSTALDLLLTQDLVDRERHQQGTYSEELLPICDLWIKGECSGARAAACRARHFYSDSDSRGRAKYCSVSSKLSRFSSPYRARLVTEQVKVQREEVNLETGKKVTWHETKEQEFIDLTGSSPLDMIDVSSDDESDEHDHSVKKDFQIVSALKVETTTGTGTALGNSCVVERSTETKYIKGVALNDGTVVKKAEHNVSVKSNVNLTESNTKEILKKRKRDKDELEETRDVHQENLVVDSEGGKSRHGCQISQTKKRKVEVPKKVDGLLEEGKTENELQAESSKIGKTKRKRSKRKRGKRSRGKKRNRVKREKL